MLDTSDPQVYMFVFCFWKGKNTGRAVIAIQERLCPQMHAAPSYTLVTAQNQVRLCVEERL